MFSIRISWLILITLSFVLLSQLIWLQIVKGKDFALRSAQNRFRIEGLPSSRGIFFDRNGEPLVENLDSGRRYLFPEDFGHILGYIGEANQTDLTLFSVDSGQSVGKAGLERENNGVLRGEDGGKVVEVSATGKPLRTFSQTQAKPGSNIQLSLDRNLQVLSYQLLKESTYKGAVIVGTPTASLYTIVSSPSFDPNIFTQNNPGTENERAINELFSRNDQPMFSRAVSGLYPPASTFKLVTATAALEEGAVTASTVIEDTGEISLGGIKFGNWYYGQYGKTDGLVTVTKALQRSNDIFFYKVGETVGINKLANWGHVMGFGKPSGIRLSGEASGLVPDEEWKQDTLKEHWYTGDTYNTAIGQGNLMVTPLQVFNLTTVFANGGYQCIPEVIQSIGERPSKTIQNMSADKDSRCSKLPISPQTLALIKSGMKAACEPGGTGWPLFGFKVKNDHLPIDGENFIEDASASAKMVHIPVACKTGTAETNRTLDNGKQSSTHAWFTAFAPSEKPEIVITVLLEEAGQGSDKAGPIAREILKAYFEGKK